MAGGNLRRRLPALRLGPHREGQPVRLDAVQGQLPLRRLPRALRLLQVHLSGRRTPTMARFHSLDVVDVRQRDARRRRRHPEAARRGRRALRLHPGPVPDLPPQVRRRRAAPQLLDLRRQGRGLPAGRHQARRRRRLLDLGQRGAEGRRDARGHAADGPLLHRRSSPRRPRHYLGFAGGSGITPLLSIIKTVLAAEPRSTFTLVYANRQISSIMFREELEDLKNRYLGRLSIDPRPGIRGAGHRPLHRPRRRGEVRGAVPHLDRPALGRPPPSSAAPSR